MYLFIIPSLCDQQIGDQVTAKCEKEIYSQVTMPEQPATCLILPDAPVQKAPGVKQEDRQETKEAKTIEIRKKDLLLGHTIGASC